MKNFEDLSVKFCIFVLGLMAGYAWAWHVFN